MGGGQALDPHALTGRWMLAAPRSGAWPGEVGSLCRQRSQDGYEPGSLRASAPQPQLQEQPLVSAVGLSGAQQRRCRCRMVTDAWICWVSAPAGRSAGSATQLPLQRTLRALRSQTLLSHLHRLYVPEKKKITNNLGTQMGNELALKIESPPQPTGTWTRGCHRARQSGLCSGWGQHGLGTPSPACVVPPAPALVRHLQGGHSWGE